MALINVRPSPSASILSAIAKTRTLNSASFSSNPGSTAFRDTINLSGSYRLPGDTRVRLRARWWLRLGAKVMLLRVRALRGRLAFDKRHKEIEQGLPAELQV